MVARCGLMAAARTGTPAVVFLVVAALAIAPAFAQPGGRRGPGAGPNAGPGAGRGPAGPSVGGPGGPGGLGSPGLGVPGAGAPGAGAVPRVPPVPVPGAPATPVTVPAVPPPASPLPPSGRAAAGAMAFTPEWYAQHPDAWQHPKPYAEWRSAPVPPAAVVNAFFGTDGGANPSLTTMTNVEWLSLGVFASPARAGGQPTSLQQLALSKSGQLKGVMYDAATGVVQPISGMAEVGTGKVSWNVGQAGSLGYETSLDELLKQAPAVTVATPAGRQAGSLTLVPAGK